MKTTTIPYRPLPRLLRSMQCLVLGCLILFAAPGSARAQQTCSGDPPNWCVNPADYASNMSVTGQLRFAGVATTDTDDLVAAFDDTGAVRGWATGTPFGGETRYFLTVYGNTNGTPLTFKAYDASAGDVRNVTETLTFTADGSVGTPGAPFLFNAPAGVPPAQVVLSAPADGTTALPTTPQVDLGWVEAADALSYDLQVATDNGFAQLVKDETGLTASPYAATGLLRGTTYYWRVRGVNGNGSGSWSALWRFTTLLNAPTSAPALAAPTDGATAVVLTPTLDWDALAGAATYDVQLDDDSDFSSPLVDQAGLSATAYAVPGGVLVQGAPYFWRARGVNEGGAGLWATAFDFVTVLEAPALSAPSDGATGLPTTLDLTWNAVPPATSYDLQVATNAGFTSLVVDESGLTGTTWQVSGLQRGVQYFWRVRARTSAAASAWSAARSFTTIIPAPSSPPVLVAPPDGAALTILTPTLDWDALAGAATYDVQLDDDSDFSSPLVDQAGLSTTAYAVPGGVLANESTYYWRARGVNVGGAGPWAAAFRFDTLEPPPAVPVLLDPPNGVIDQPLQVILRWAAAARAASYDVQVATDNDFGHLVVDQTGVSGLFYSLTGLSPSTIYFWRVRGRNGSGASDWPAAFSFATVLAPPATAPVLQAPLVGATTDLQPQLRWQQVATATSYGVQVSASPGFGTLVVNASGVNGTAYGVPQGVLEEQTQYYWRVRGANSAGAGPWSDHWSFVTQQTTLDAPVLSAPDDGATGQPLSVDLLWQAVTGATVYDVEVAADAGFADVVAAATNLSATTFAAADLSDGTEHFWHVRARNATEISDWSAAHSFTTLTLAPETTPTPTTPADGSTTADQTPTLVWSPLDEATGYDVQLATGGDFSTTGATGKLLAIIHEATGLSVPSYSVPAGVLDAATEYHWRARGTNPGGAGPWSASMRFTTPEAAPGAPAPRAPMDGAIEQPTTVTLRWQAAPGAVVYQVQVATDAAFTALVVQQSGVPDTSVVATGLAASTVYYWRVQAGNGAGVGPWSVVFRFTTMMAAPVLLEPSDGVMTGTLTPLLRWEAIAGVQTYTLEVSEQADFAASVSYNGLTEPSRRLPGLSAATVYYWRVRAVNAVAVSAWSAVWRFTTPEATGTAVERDEGAVPTGFELMPNYPNPFNPSTTIRFGVPVAGPVTLRVYDALGREVETLVDRMLGPGRYEVRWDAAAEATSGIYFYRLDSGARRLTRAMLLVK